jgi:TonB family protein
MFLRSILIPSTILIFAFGANGFNRSGSGRGNELCSWINRDSNSARNIRILILFFILVCIGRACFSQPCDISKQWDRKGRLALRTSTFDIAFGPGSTKLAFHVLGVEKEFQLIMKVTDGKRCYTKGEAVIFEFVSGKEVPLKNAIEGDCEHNIIFVFSDSLNNMDTLGMFIDNTVTSVRYPGTRKRVNFLPQAGARLRYAVKCLVEALYEKSSAVEFDVILDTPRADTDSLFTVIETVPEYPGGYVALLEFIKSNLRYPDDARAKGISGTVHLEYLVNKKGYIEKVKTIKGVSPSIDAEAERVVRAMPRWIPGTQNGKPVFVRFVLPIRFTLNNKKKKSE